jgi:hypothetical protein
MNICSGLDRNRDLCNGITSSPARFVDPVLFESGEEGMWGSQKESA